MADVIQDYTWNLKKIYPSMAAFKKDFEEVKKMADAMENHKGFFTKSKENLLMLLKDRDQLLRKMEKLYTYAKMKMDEDNKNSTYVSLHGSTMVLFSEISSKISFIEPELLKTDYSKILSFMSKSEELRIYDHYFHHIFRLKDHVLKEEEENLLARMGQVLNGPSQIFTAFNNADVTFGRVTLKDGKTRTLTHGTYISLMEQKDRKVRKEAFEKMYAPYKAFENTLSAAYDFNVRTNVIQADLRGYKDARALALMQDNVDHKVYDNLIKAVNESLPHMHKYMELRKSVLRCKKMYMYDIYQKLFTPKDDKYSFDQAVKLMINGLEPLGREYLDIVKSGISKRWIDVYEKPGKTSGAYSFGSYDTMPYILLNYGEGLKDVFTLVHEMGHSLHSYYTRKAQSFIYGGHSIFTAEVASTVNEVLLMKYLLSNAKDKAERKYLLSLYIEDFRTTLFRQTMFSEFEMIVHEASQKGTILTAPYLNELYYGLNSKYYGDALEDTPLIAYEWARIPHFYRAFYVYKYATGYSMANAISEKLIRGDLQAKEGYLEFLKSGEKDYPINLLKIAGVDAGSIKPVKDALSIFSHLIHELESLI